MLRQGIVRKLIRDHQIELLFADSDLEVLLETIQYKNELLLENVYADPCFQRRGYGRKTLAYAEQLAVQAGVGTVRLSARPASISIGALPETPFREEMQCLPLPNFYYDQEGARVRGSR